MFSFEVTRQLGGNKPNREDVFARNTRNHHGPLKTTKRFKLVYRNLATVILTVSETIIFDGSCFVLPHPRRNLHRVASDYLVNSLCHKSKICVFCCLLPFPSTYSCSMTPLGHRHECSKGLVIYFYLQVCICGVNGSRPSDSRGILRNPQK